MASSTPARRCRRSSAAPSGAARTCARATSRAPIFRASDEDPAMTEPFIAQLCERVRDHAARKAALRIRGGGSKDFYGDEARGDALDMLPYAGIVAYEPQELVLTVRAGTPLDLVEAALGEKRQMLPFEPPHFGASDPVEAARTRATIGGVVATGLSGPRRPYAGAVRDFVLGTRIVNGKGEDLSFGGRVIKNVAGYDVSRLMAGAAGPPHRPPP